MASWIPCTRTNYTTPISFERILPTPTIVKGIHQTITISTKRVVLSVTRIRFEHLRLRLIPPSINYMEYENVTYVHMLYYTNMCYMVLSYIVLLRVCFWTGKYLYYLHIYTIEHCSICMHMYTDNTERIIHMFTAHARTDAHASTRDAVNLQDNAPVCHACASTTTTSTTAAHNQNHASPSI